MMPRACLVKGLVATLALLALPACEGERLSGDDVLAEASELENPAPGLYDVTTELVSFDVTGAPPAQADRLREQMAQVEKETRQQCIGESESRQGFEPLLKELVEGINSMDCGFTEFAADAPRVSAKLSCDGPLDAEAGVAFAGTTSAEGYDVTMDLSASSRIIAGGAMEMKMRVTSERVGDCEAEAEGDLAAG